MSDLHCRAPFGVYALSLLLIPLLLYLLREPNHTGGEPLAPALDNRVLRIWPVFAVDFGVMAAFYIVPTQLPFLVIGTFSYGRIRRRLSILEVFILIGFLQGIGLGAVGLADELYQAFGPMIFAGLGAGLAMANTKRGF